MISKRRNFDKYYHEKPVYEKNCFNSEKDKTIFYDLVDCLNEQTKLDETFRNEKFWLQMCRKESKY